MMVTLTQEHRQAARALAEARHEASIGSRLMGKHGGATAGLESMRLHAVGAIGEMAVAVALELPLPTSVNTFKREPDLYHHIEVRTRTRLEYELIVRDDDDDAARFVLVFLNVDKNPAQAFIRGWIEGKAAKRATWRRQHGGREAAFFVPLNELRPIDSLEQMIHGRRDITPHEDEVFNA